MDWKAYILLEVEESYHATEGLMKRVDPATLDWKPSQENNWMTMGQLLQHTATACGMGFKGFVTNDWGEGMDQPAEADMKPEEMLPPAEALPTAESVESALDILNQDKQTTLSTLESLSNEELATRTVSAPWDPRELILGVRLMQMVDHIKQHRAQLFYYLKLQGQPVTTWDFYGMDMPS